MADRKQTRTSRVSDSRPISYPSDKRTEAANDHEIRPFSFHALEGELLDLQRRVLDTRWPEKEAVADDSQGMPLEPLRELAQYWATDYDWWKFEAKLNVLPNFITEIDGLDIHFIHVRSKHENALPVIITHGWPGSIVEELKIIDPLVNPTAHGGSAEDAFDVVIPSMPGYGFSGIPATNGWDPARIARAWVTLMKRLGYDEFVAQGTDWGAIITDVMATQTPPGLLGIHTNMAGVLPPEVWASVAAGAPKPPGMSDEETHTYEKLKAFFAKGVAYALEMGTRPQTLYGLADSPIFLAAWLFDHGDGDAQPTRSWMEAIKKPTGSVPDTELTRDDVLDNITLYWLTNTGVSSGRLYWESKFTFFGVKNVSLPVAVSVFPGEFYQAPRSWAERAYPKLIHYNKLDKGGHFAAWEQPELFAAEMRAGLKSLR
jgi:pimeloyl-ACP methyl ester carboxylesterase